MKWENGTDLLRKRYYASDSRQKSICMNPATAGRWSPLQREISALVQRWFLTTTASRGPLPYNTGAFNKVECLPLLQRKTPSLEECIRSWHSTKSSVYTMDSQGVSTQPQYGNVFLLPEKETLYPKFRIFSSSLVDKEMWEGELRWFHTYM